MHVTPCISLAIYPIPLLVCEYISKLPLAEDFVYVARCGMFSQIYIFALF